jgi:hypothetical protein
MAKERCDHKRVTKGAGGVSGVTGPGPVKTMGTAMDWMLPLLGRIPTNSELIAETFDRSESQPKNTHKGWTKEWSQDFDEGNRKDMSDRQGRAAAEKRAAELIASKRTVNHEELTYVLAPWVGRRNRDRKRVLPPGWKYCESDTFGLVKSHSGGLLISNISKEFPNMLEVLGLYADHVTEGKGFNWTSITLNTQFASERHRDSNNEGPSLI